MSYYMEIGDDSFNYTYNVSKMWYMANERDGIRAHYGMTGCEALKPLIAIRDYMEENKEDLVKLNPHNGWGDFDGALVFVYKLIIASIENQLEIWEGD